MAGRWERVEIDTAEDSYFDASSVEVAGGRLVASGSVGVGCCDGTTIAWESTDGRHWKPHELLEALDGAAFTGAHAQAGAVAVGDWITFQECEHGPDGCRPAAAAWWSDRSGRWHRVPDDPKVFGHARMDQVWKRPDGYTALGHLVGDDGRAEAPMIWRSPDGRRWHRQPPDGPTPVEAWETVETPRGIVAVTGRQAWQSTDGVAWERTELLGDPTVSVRGTGRLFRVGAAALAVFDTSTAKDQSLEVHWSGDGRHWEVIRDAFGPPTAQWIEISSVRALRHAIVAVGTYDGQPTVWESHDGRRWRRTILPDSDFRDASVSDITDFGGRIVLVGGVELPGGNKPRAQPLAWLRPTIR